MDALGQFLRYGMATHAGLTVASNVWPTVCRRHIAFRTESRGDPLLERGDGAVGGRGGQSTIAQHERNAMLLHGQATDRVVDDSGSLGVVVLANAVNLGVNLRHSANGGRQPLRIGKFLETARFRASSDGRRVPGLADSELPSHCPAGPFEPALGFPKGTRRVEDPAVAQSQQREQAGVAAAVRQALGGLASLRVPIHLEGLGGDDAPPSPLHELDGGRGRPSDDATMVVEFAPAEAGQEDAVIVDAAAVAELLEGEGTIVLGQFVLGWTNVFPPLLEGFQPAFRSFEYAVDDVLTEVAVDCLEAFVLLGPVGDELLQLGLAVPMDQLVLADALWARLILRVSARRSTRRFLRSSSVSQVAKNWLERSFETSIAKR